MILAYTFISWRTLRQMLKYCWNCFKFIYLYILKRDQLFWEDFLLTLKGLSIELFVLRVMVFNQQILHSWLVVINYEHSLTLQLYCPCCCSFFLIVLGLFEWQWICIFLNVWLYSRTSLVWTRRDCQNVFELSAVWATEVP
jgi:hypothetical protein